MVTLLLTSLLLAPAAHAQDPVSAGVVTDGDLAVVQPLLYPKTARFEIATHVALMPFDAYTWAPSLQVAVDRHVSETISYGAVLGLGFGFKTGTYRELERDLGVAPYAFRYLGSALVGAAWAPIYGKASLDGARIVHYDLYLAGRGGFTLEQSVIPAGGMPVAPTLSPAIGARVFLGKDVALRLEFRDDLLFQWRKLTEVVALKQNPTVSVGFSILAKRGRL